MAHSNGRRKCRQYRLAMAIVVVLVLIWEVLGHHFWLRRIRYRTKVDELTRFLLVPDPQIQGYRNEPPGVVGMLTRWDADRYMANYVQAAFKLVNPENVLFLGDLLDEGSAADPATFSDYAYRFHRLFPWSLMPQQTFVAGDNDIGGEGGEWVTTDKVALFSDYFNPPNGNFSSRSGLWTMRVNTLALTPDVDKSVRADVMEFLSSFKDQPHLLRSTTLLLSHIPILQMPREHSGYILKTLKTASVLSAHDHCLSYTAMNTTSNRMIATKKFKGQGRDVIVLDGSDLPCHGVSEGCVLDLTVPTVSYRMGVSCMAITIVDVDAHGRIQHVMVVPLPHRYPVLACYLLLLIAFCAVAVLM